MSKYEPCSICEEYIEGVICDKDKCPVAIMKKENERLKGDLAFREKQLYNLAKEMEENNG